jgi:hypothetical protein
MRRTAGCPRPSKFLAEAQPRSGARLPPIVMDPTAREQSAEYSPSRTTQRPVSASM